MSALRDESVRRRGAWLQNGFRSDLLLQVITGKIRYLTRDVTFLHLFPFSLYIRGKVGFESSRMVLVYRIKLDLTNRVGNKKKFQRNSSYIQVKGCGRMIG